LVLIDGRLVAGSLTEFGAAAQLNAAPQAATAFNSEAESDGSDEREKAVG
jgi:hypothetical protein